MSVARIVGVPGSVKRAAVGVEPSPVYTLELRFPAQPQGFAGGQWDQLLL